MPWNLLLLPLLGGYLFCIQHPVVSYRIERLSRERLLIESALWGFLFLAAGYAFTRLAAEVVPALAVWWKSVLPHRFSGAAVASLILGGLAGALCRDRRASDGLLDRYLGGFIDEGRIERGKQKWLQQTASELELLFDRSSREKTPLMVTLADRKVYIGQVEWAPSRVASTDAYFKIIPIMSGYRNDKSLKVEITTLYTSTLIKLFEKDEGGDEALRQQISEMGHIIRFSLIESASVFSERIFEEFRAQEEEDRRSLGTEGSP